MYCLKISYRPALDEMCQVLRHCPGAPCSVNTESCRTEWIKADVCYKYLCFARTQAEPWSLTHLGTVTGIAVASTVVLFVGIFVAIHFLYYEKRRPRAQVGLLTCQECSENTVALARANLEIIDARNRQTDAERLSDRAQQEARALREEVEAARTVAVQAVKRARALKAACGSEGEVAARAAEAGAAGAVRGAEALPSSSNVSLGKEF